MGYILHQYIEWNMQMNYYFYGKAYNYLIYAGLYYILKQPFKIRRFWGWVMLVLINYNYLIEGFVILESTQDLHFIIKYWFIELSKKLAKLVLIEKNKEMWRYSQSVLIKIHFLHCTYCFINRNVKFSILHKSWKLHPFAAQIKWIGTLNWILH